MSINCVCLFRFRSIIIMSSNNIPNAVIGGILTALGTQCYNQTNNSPLNLCEVFWTLTTFRQKHLLQTLPFIAGIFITAGVLFDWIQYQSFGKMEPFGASQAILVRSSMYGFAISGFCQGLGSKLIGGDLIFFGINQIANKNCIFLTTIAFSFVSATLLSLLLDSDSLNFLTDSKINPHMQFMHVLSANITISLGVIFILVTAILMKIKNKSFKTIFSHIGTIFLCGVLIALGYGVCGLANRNVVFNGLTPGTNWDPVLLVYLSTTIITNLLISTISSAIQVKQKLAVNTSSVAQEKRSEIQYRVHFLLGGLLLGISWGIGGLDILSYLMHSAIFSIPVVIIFGAFLILGTMIGHAINF